VKHTFTRFDANWMILRANASKKCVKSAKNCKKMQKSARKCGFLQEIGQKNGKIRKNVQKFARFFLVGL